MKYWLPSDDYIKEVWLRSRQIKGPLGIDKQEFQRLRMANIKGEYWRADHSFKLLRLVHLHKGICS